MFQQMLISAIVFTTIAPFGMSIESPVMNQTANNGTNARTKAIVEASFKAWSDGTGSPFDLLTDDATWTIVGRSAAAGTYRGREAFLRDVIRPFNARMREPLKPVIRRIVVDGPMVVVFFDAKGVARDGVAYVNTYAWFLELRDERVVAASAFFDSIAFDDLWKRVSP
jgi:ketosteroid isomerase-like protein